MRGRYPRRGIRGAATPNNLPHNHRPFSRRAGATRYPRWGAGRARLPPTTRHPITHPSPVVPDSDPVPMVRRGTGAATPTNRPPLTHPSPVVPDPDPVPMARGTGPANSTNLPPLTHIRHSPKPSSPTFVPRLPRLRSGTQGGAATPTNLRHNHTCQPPP